MGTREMWGLYQRRVVASGTRIMRSTPQGTPRPIPVANRGSGIVEVIREHREVGFLNVYVVDEGNTERMRGEALKVERGAKLK